MRLIPLCGSVVVAVVTSCSPIDGLDRSENPLVAPNAETKLRASLGVANNYYTTLEAYSVEYPHATTRGHFGLFRNQLTGELIKVACDDNGVTASGPELQLRDLKARRESHGALSDRLHLQMGDAASHDVVVGYLVPSAPKPSVAWNPAVALADLDVALAQRATLAAQLGSNARTRVLQTLVASGSTVTKAPIDSPYIRATVPIAALEKMATNVDILAIDLADPVPVKTATDLFYDSDDMESKETFASVGKGASGVKVGLYEGSGGCGLWRYTTYGGQVVPAAFKDWSGYTLLQTPAAVLGCDNIPEGSPCSSNCGNSPGYCRGGVCAAWHPVLVASSIGASVDCANCGNDRLANKASIYFANEGNVADRLAWFHNNQVHVINNSEYKNSTDAANYSVREYYATFTHIAGNEDGMQTPVTCNANAICVGTAYMTSVNNIDHWKTEPQDNADVYRFPLGTYPYRFVNGIQDNPVSDVEKPDILMIMGPALDVSSGTWTGCMGTSCAAPKAAGMVALLQELAPWTASWPEAVRPIIMASAVSHNVDDAQLSLNSGTDEHDGAGVPVASVMKKIVERNWFTYGTLTPSSFNGNNEYSGPIVTLQAGEGVRVVFGYLHCIETVVSNDSEFLAIDLDLQLWVNGQLVGWSWSSNNSLEFWEYTNTSGSSQNVQIVIKKYGTWQVCNGYQREYYGLS